MLLALPKQILCLLRLPQIHARGKELLKKRILAPPKCLILQPRNLLPRNLILSEPLLL
jgi:hypothetical protein